MLFAHLNPTAKSTQLGDNPFLINMISARIIVIDQPASSRIFPFCFSGQALACPLSICFGIRVGNTDYRIIGKLFSASELC